QATGGRFGGVLGVLGALEVLRTLVEAGYQTFAPIEVVNWTNEEGARFSPAMTSSGVFAGAFDRAWAISRQDRAGTSFGEALEAIGYCGPEKCGAHPLSAFFELHIRSEEHTSELQSLAYLVCRLLLEKKNKQISNSKS